MSCKEIGRLNGKLRQKEGVSSENRKREDPQPEIRRHDKRSQQHSGDGKKRLPIEGANKCQKCFRQRPQFRRQEGFLKERREITNQNQPGRALMMDGREGISEKRACSFCRLFFWSARGFFGLHERLLETNSKGRREDYPQQSCAGAQQRFKCRHNSYGIIPNFPIKKARSTATGLFGKNNWRSTGTLLSNPSVDDCQNLELRGAYIIRASRRSHIPFFKRFSGA